METRNVRNLPRAGSDVPEPGPWAEPTWIEELIEAIDVRLEQEHWHCEWPGKEEAA